MRPFDVLIVGAGVVGSAVAREAAQAGLYTGVVEAASLARSATAAAMGHLVAMDDSPAQLALTAFSRRLWNEESSRMPAAVEYLNCGTIWVAADAGQAAPDRSSCRSQ